MCYWPFDLFILFEREGYCSYMYILYTCFWRNILYLAGFFFWIDMYSIVGVLWAAFFINVFLGAIFFL